MTDTRNADEPAAAVSAPAAARGVRAQDRDRLVVLLALLSGATDAIGFVGLGAAFTSVMTGNMVLIGVAAGTGDTTALGLTLAAIAGYVVGVGVGARVAGKPQPGDGAWPTAVTRALLIEGALFAAYAGAWWAHGGHPPESWFGVLLALNSMALGLQSSAILRFGVSGLSTTYLTGTLTTLVTRVATGEPLNTVGHPARLLGALILGAGLGAAAVSREPVLAPVLQLGLVLVVLAALAVRRRRR